MAPRMLRPRGPAPRRALGPATPQPRSPKQIQLFAAGAGVGVLVGLAALSQAVIPAAGPLLPGSLAPVGASSSTRQPPWTGIGVVPGPSLAATSPTPSWLTPTDSPSPLTPSATPSLTPPGVSPSPPVAPSPPAPAPAPAPPPTTTTTTSTWAPAPPTGTTEPTTKGSSGNPPGQTKKPKP